MNARNRPGYESESPLSIQDGTGFLADTPGGSSSATSVASRDNYAKNKRFNSHSGLSSDSSRLNSAPDSLADDWDLEEGGLEQVNVVARVRPLSDAEKKRGDKDCVKIQHNSSSITLGNSEKTKTFTFNAVFDETTTQSEVLEKCGIKQMIELAVDGYSCTTFAYGQTGSGKTYTITGPASQDSLMPSRDKYGLIQRSFIHLFDVLRQKSGPNITFTLSASYLEIYNEQVKDLLNPSGRASLPVRWSKDKGFYVENLFVVDCETLDDLLAVLEEGMSQRQIATTNINEYSSRSHTIVSLQIDSETPDPEESTLYITKHGRLSFVDLAGSEKVKEIGNTGELLTETTNINKSLLTLGNCISALSDNRKRSGHIPYRDSKLTKLLADSLGGNGVTLMIACVTPSAYCLSESLSTLRYANRAKRIKNKPIIKMDPREKLILSLKREVRLLRNENVYLRQCLEFPSNSKPGMRRNDTEESLPIFSEDSLSGDNKTPVPEDFNRSKGPSETSLPAEGNKKERRDTVSSQMSSFTPRSAADSSLYEMLQEYMVENEKLRSENSDLNNVKHRAMTEHEHLSKENDKLMTKLDELERVFAASPISMTRTVSGVSSHSQSALRGRNSNQHTVNGSPSGQPGQRASSQGSALLQSPDWQQSSKAVSGSGGSGGRDRHKIGLDSSGNQDQVGQLPPVDSKRGVPNGYRDPPKPHPYNGPTPAHQQPSPPHQYQSHPTTHQQQQQGYQQQASTHQSLPGSFKPGDAFDGASTSLSRPGREQHSYPPTQKGTHRYNEFGSSPETSLSFPPPKGYHSQSSLNSMHPFPEESSSSPRGVTNVRQDHPQGDRPAGRDAPFTGETTHGRPQNQNRVDIYIPSVPSLSKESHPDSVGKKDLVSPRRDNVHSHPDLHAVDKKAKSSPKKPASVIKPPQGGTAGGHPTQAPTGYSSRNKKNAWGQGKGSGGGGGGKPSPKTQRKDQTVSTAEPSDGERNLDAIPHTPIATPPPVKYKPKGTAHLLAVNSRDPSKPPADPESLQEINEKLRQELLDLDGEIQYMKYVNKSKGGNPQPAKPAKGKRR